MYTSPYASRAQGIARHVAHETMNCFCGAKKHCSSMDRDMALQISLTNILREHHTTLGNTCMRSRTLCANAALLRHMLRKSFCNVAWVASNSHQHQLITNTITNHQSPLSPALSPNTIDKITNTSTITKHYSQESQAPALSQDSQATRPRAPSRCLAFLWTPFARWCRFVGR